MNWCLPGTHFLHLYGTNTIFPCLFFFLKHHASTEPLFSSAGKRSVMICRFGFPSLTNYTHTDTHVTTVYNISSNIAVTKDDDIVKYKRECVASEATRHRATATCKSTSLWSTEQTFKCCKEHERICMQSCTMMSVSNTVFLISWMSPKSQWTEVLVITDFHPHRQERVRVLYICWNQQV